ncbi:Protein CONTINUOUS VASCULAR RING 1 [Linum grandiflorum]
MILLGYIFISLTSVLGLRFVTSFLFIFVVGVFMSSWLGASVLSLREWFIKRMHCVHHIYNASKQMGAAISSGWTLERSFVELSIRRHKAFKEVAIIRHPCIGEDAFGFITSSVTLRNYAGDEELCCFYVLTNHR